MVTLKITDGNITISMKSKLKNLNVHFRFGTSGKLMVLGVPILKHLRVSQLMNYISAILTI